nr:immunoglobulin heavy chain junction region [Macaca mulatta]MOW50041.1 immunoglobulin heavy chain junction region [Macaca mulatta]
CARDSWGYSFFDHW